MQKRRDALPPQGTEHLGGTTLINTTDNLSVTVLSFLFNAEIRCIFIQSSGAGSMCSCKGSHQPPSLCRIPHIYYSLSSPVCNCDFTQKSSECQPKRDPDFIREAEEVSLSVPVPYCEAPPQPPDVSPCLHAGSPSLRLM